MKVTCSKFNLVNGINTVQKAVSSRSTLPILEGILLEAGENIKLTGNDLEIGIECLVEGKVHEEGAVVINSRMFGEIARKLPDSEVLIETTENNTVVIECDKSHFEIKGLSASGFPAIPEIEKKNSLKTTQQAVKDMIRQTIFAVSSEESRTVLTGSYISCKDGELTFVSIDGYRLALRKRKVGQENQGFSAIVPGKTLNEISKILESSDEELNIYGSSNQIMFEMKNCKVVSRLLEGEYLNYNSMFLKDHDAKVRVRTQDLLSCMERASLISVEEKNVPVILTIGGDKMVVSSNTSIGKVREEIDVEHEGKDMTIGFNPRYYIEALRVIDDEYVDILFSSEIGPCMIRPTEGESFTYLNMPVRTKTS